MLTVHSLHYNNNTGQESKTEIVITPVIVIVSVIAFIVTVTVVIIVMYIALIVNNRIPKLLSDMKLTSNDVTLALNQVNGNLLVAIAYMHS